MTWYYMRTSDYPVDFDNTCLLEIYKLTKNYRNKISDVGFSGHHLGISIDNKAYTLGAKYIERHFTLDRTWKGTECSFIRTFRIRKISERFK